MAATVLSAVLLGLLIHHLIRDPAPLADPLDGSSSAPAEPSKPSTLAYLAADELALLVDGRLVSRIEGDFSGYRTAPGWTSSGRYVFAVTAAGTDEATVAVIDRTTATSFSLPCVGCSSAISVGTDEVLVVDAKRRIHRLALPRGRDGTPEPLDAPVRFSQQLTALAGLPEVALFAGADLDTTAAYGGPEQLLLASSDGQVKRIGTTKGNIAVSRGTAAATTAYGGARMAFVEGGHFDACRENATVTVLDPATGRRQETPGLDAAEGPTPFGVDGRGSRVVDLWWEDGLLYATTIGWSCGEASVWAHGAPILWRLEANSSWSRVRGQLPTQSVRTRSGLVFASLAPATDGQSATALTWFSGPEQRVVHPAVTAIATPPQ
ncbi:hypothetical protein ACGFNF_20735 [Micromonospora sp. NPDC048868]|uniref:hypothetical protein n=1 Tax=Micromonospora sp. NPDC048868 TaxID=3364258 RepID=UPI00371356D3